MVILCGIAMGSVAQDLIINADGDSLNVKILNVKEDKMSFVYKKDVRVKNFIVPVFRIKEYQKSFYPVAIITEEDLKLTQFNKVSLKVYGGYSQLLAKISDQIPAELESYTKDLKSGYHFGGDLGFFWSKTSGMGLKYVIFKTKNEGSYYVNRGFNSGFSTSIKDNITINFIAPTYYAKAILNDNKSAFYTNLSLGLMTYKNLATLESEYKISSSMLGGSVEIGFDIAILNNLSLNFGTGVVAGAFKNYKIDGISSDYGNQDVETQNPENLTRLDLSGGLRFSF